MPVPLTQIHQLILLRVLKTEIATALKVCEVIFLRGLAGVEKPANPRAFLESQLYRPGYRPLL